ncbi:Ff.00g002200.m01.CDS01 [Fusarium sp. VM40]|nr:Ff.00g002200.m01.CDS01 [Fusarium sp. VM40]
MSQKRKRSTTESYNIAWIAVLPIERAAAIALLDERHDEPEDFDQHSNDSNTYDWGKVGQHDVVITSLPAGVYGTTSAAITTSHLLSSLPHIRIGLLVGIGGGIPRPGRDIRLGDVVVSQPDGKSGGVVQYDLGKAKADSTWERKGSLNMPPTVLLSALAKLQAEHELEDSQTAKILEAMITKFPRMKPQYSFQGVDKDILFSSTFKHSGGDNCDLCDLSEQVIREKRESTDPVIHFGLIASENTLVKDAETRENIFKLAEEECLCVEMEAAGLVNSFPCLVIRGICDYADSHKNNRWQRYASATAAAFAVELLKYVPVRQLQAAPRALELIERVNQTITDLNNTVKITRAQSVVRRLPISRGAAYDSASNELESMYPESPTLFWLEGMAGTGKSTISRTVAHRLAEQRIFGGSFFFKKVEAARATPENLFTTIAASLHAQQPALSRHIEDVIENNPQIHEKPYLQQFKTLLLEPISRVRSDLVKTIVMVIDALDECDHEVITNIITDVLPNASDLRLIRLKIFLTSRPELPIKAGFSSLPLGTAYQDLILQNVSDDTIREDLETFFQVRMAAIRDRYNAQEKRIEIGWPTKEQIAILVDASFPLFISASTLCRFMDNRKLGNPKRLMKQLLDAKDRGHQSSLDQMYSAILYQQFNDNDTAWQREQTVREFRLVVGSLILLRDPLTIPAFARLLSNDQVGDDAEEWQQIIVDRLELLHSVLNVPPPSERLSQPVRILHLSFSDYLLDPLYFHINLFWIPETEIHGILLRKCFQTIIVAWREGSCESHPPEAYYRSRTEIDYACRYWADHAKEGRADETAGSRILGFLEQHFLHWLGILILIDNTGSTLRNGQLSEFLEHAIELLSDRQASFQLDFSQVFSTGLLFCPTNSRVRQIFHPEIPAWIALQPQVDLIWTSYIRSFFMDYNHEVDGLEFSPDSRLLAVYTFTTFSLRILQVSTGNCLHTFHPGVIKPSDRIRGIIDLRFSHDSKLLYWTWAGHVTLWCVETGQIIRDFKLSPYIPLGEASMISSHPGSSTIGGDHQEEYPVASLSFSTCLRYLVSASHHGGVFVWNMTDWKLAQQFEVPNKESCENATFMDGPSRVAVATNMAISIWDRAADEVSYTLRLPERFRCMKFFINVGLVFATGKILQVFEPDKNSIERWPNMDAIDSIEANGSNNMATYSRDIKAIDVWRLDTRHHLKRISINFSHRLTPMALSVDGGLLASGDGHLHEVVRIWEIEDNGKRASQFHPVSHLQMSPDSLMVATVSPGSCEFIVTFWSTETGKMLNCVKIDDVGFTSEAPTYLQFSPDSTLLLMVYMSHIYIWEVETGARVQTLVAPIGVFECSAAISCSSDLVTTICTEHEESSECFAHIWQVSTGECVLTLRESGPRKLFLFVSFVHDSSFLIIQDTLNTLRLWDSVTGEYLSESQHDEEGKLMMAAYTSKSRLLAVAFESYYNKFDRWSVDIIQWDTGGCLIRVYLGEAPCCLRFGDDGRRVFTSYSGLSSSLPLRPFTLETPERMALREFIAPSLRISMGFGLGFWLVSWKNHHLFQLPSNTDIRTIVIRGPLIAFASTQGHVAIMKLDLLKLDEMHKRTSGCQRPTLRCLYT